MIPIDVASNESLAFVEEYAPINGRRLLEIGCGGGDLALALKNRGFNVRAIDISAEAIESAKQKGVDAECADILTYKDQPFDIVLFTRSLHHIEPLDDAVTAAKNLLKPGGVLLIEDFLPEIADEAAIQWFREKRSAIPESAVNEDARKHTKISTLEQWQEHFTEHRIAEGSAVRRAVEKQLPQSKVTRVPYLYRHIGDSIKVDADNAAAIAQAALDEEKAAIDNGSLVAIGMRIVAHI
jgi:ubiquinone/menaquinone biosynthesis C-methylase UbiE